MNKATLGTIFGLSFLSILKNRIGSHAEFISLNLPDKCVIDITFNLYEIDDMDFIQFLTNYDTNIGSEGFLQTFKDCLKKMSPIDVEPNHFIDPNDILDIDSMRFVNLSSQTKEWEPGKRKGPLVEYMMKKLKGTNVLTFNLTYETDLFDKHRYKKIVHSFNENPIRYINVASEIRTVIPLLKTENVIQDEYFKIRKFSGFEFANLIDKAFNNAMKIQYDRDVLSRTSIK